MFDNLFIVSTAISAFNNNTLVGPFFFAVGLLMIPMFLMVYVYGKDLVGTIKILIINLGYGLYQV